MVICYFVSPLFLGEDKNPSRLSPSYVDSDLKITSLSSAQPLPPDHPVTKAPQDPCLSETQWSQGTRVENLFPPHAW